VMIQILQQVRKDDVCVHLVARAMHAYADEHGPLFACSSLASMACSTTRRRSWTRPA
jgi:hypothetical protein